MMGGPRRKATQRRDATLSEKHLGWVEVGDDECWQDCVEGDWRRVDARGNRKSDAGTRESSLKAKQGIRVRILPLPRKRGRERGYRTVRDGKVEDEAEATCEVSGEGESGRGGEEILAPDCVGAKCVRVALLPLSVSRGRQHQKPPKIERGLLTRLDERVFRSQESFSQVRRSKVALRIRRVKRSLRNA